MWNNNNFPGPGSFQQGQGNFQQNYGDDGYIPFSPLNPDPQYFPQQGQYFGVDYHSPVSGSQQSTPGEYSPEIGLYNDGAFAHNQFSNSDGLEQYVPQRPATAGIGSFRPALNARAEELKAQLLKSKERARSGTPPVNTTIATSRDRRPVEGAMPFRGSPKTPLSGLDGASRKTSAVMDDDLNDLISEAKAAANVMNESIQNESNAMKPKEPINAELKTKSRSQLTRVSTRDIEENIDSKNGCEKQATKNVNRYETNGDVSDTSEGEIRETAKEDTLALHANTKENRNASQRNRAVEPTTPKLQPEEDWRGKQNYGNQERRQIDPRSVSQGKPTRAYTERHQEGDGTELKGSQAENKQDQRRRQDADQSISAGHQNRDVGINQRQHESKPKSKADDVTSLKPEGPTLAGLLLLDEDLKDWLDVTGYHNTEYRQKILNRRRALAALDAQKAKLLEEIENDERGGISTKTSSVSMLPPPMPSKITPAAPAPTPAPPAAPAAVQAVPVSKSTETSAPTKAAQETGTKRTYTDYQKNNDRDDRDRATHTGERTSQKGQGQGIKTTSDIPAEPRRPLSRGYGSFRRRSPSPRRRSLSPRRRSPSPRRRSLSPRRRSPSPDNRVIRRNDKDSSRKSRSPDRGPQASYPLKRESSYESQENKRLKTHDYPSPNANLDRWDYKNRPFVQVGNYRGRAFDPHYKGRGRGRGTWPEPREVQFENRTLQQATLLEQRIAAMKPYLDPKPLDLGGRGDTKYFIVKSFNEENIIRCVEDSIWTTQIENGDIFKTAFHKCRNVILIFSANHSRAFQGYARMENTPGSETAPAWQRNIHWERAGAFKVKWICVANTRFNRVGHLKNRLNDNQPVLVGRDGQEIEEQAGAALLKLINEEAERLLDRHSRPFTSTLWDD